ncbi:disulfide bond formation protein B [Planococcus koreensis]|uniref:disulfide bond formation protein B n=1 Tax=Planococcus koreensis TaxID=112331 RepID=UPI0039FC4210
MSKRQENIMLAMWVVALIATAGSLYFSQIRGYAPCTLCWVQRIFMYPLVIVIGVAYAQKNVRIAATTLALSIIGGGYRFIITACRSWLSFLMLRRHADKCRAPASTSIISDSSPSHF